MSQIKIYGHREAIQKHRTALSDAIHSAVVEVLSFPADKRFHRFIELEAESFIHPTDRSSNYIIIEISMFEGRSSEAKRNLIKALFSSIQQSCGIEPQDVEITIFETPKANWGIRGMPGDELTLNYKVDV
ncbi:tautomerase family protein [Aquabacterium sp. G14]|uniref:tautomerase family protein n=1 Tax=Aquabacterium sp. G14 TaxID=3130164 RepID=UPI0030A66AA4